MVVTQIYKLAIPRLGDAADMAIIEFVEQIQKKKPKKKAGKKPSQNPNPRKLRKMNLLMHQLILPQTKAPPQKKQ